MNLLKKITVCRVTNKFTITFLFLFLIFSSFVQEEKIRPNYFSLYLMTAPSMKSMNDTVAKEYGVDNTVWGIEFSLGYKWNEIFSITADVELGEPKDNNEFSQNTTMGVKESSFRHFFLWGILLHHRKKKQFLAACFKIGLIIRIKKNRLFLEQVLSVVFCITYCC